MYQEKYPFRSRIVSKKNVRQLRNFHQHRRHQERQGQFPKEQKQTLMYIFLWDFKLNGQQNLQTILYNIQVMLNFCTNFLSSSQLVRKKIESMQVFQKLIVQIYQNNIESYQLQMLMRTLQVDFGYGSIYSVIRQSLQNVCKNHRSIIYLTGLSLVRKINSYYKTSKHAQAEAPQSNKIKFLETLVNVIYYHFINIAQSNVLVCELWDMIKAKTNGSKNNNDFNIRTPELKLSILNLLTLKELIPPCDEVILIDFRGILQSLINCNQISSKENIQKLLDVYRLSDGVSEISPIITPQTPPMPALIEIKEQKKQMQKQIEKSREKQQNAVSQSKFSDIDESNWLQKAKQNPIAKKLCSRLNGMFCKEQDKKTNFFESLAADSLIEKLLELQNEESSPSFHIIRTSNLLKEYQNIQDFSVLDDDIDSIANKKKRKNKNKKKRQKQKQKLEVEEKAPLAQKSENISESIQKINQNDYKEYLQTIRFLKDLKIDDTKRANCVVEKKKIQEWKRIVEIS